MRTKYDSVSQLPFGVRDVMTDTIEPFRDIGWFAWRDDRPASASLRLRNALWWTDDGARVLSLATGTGLHASGTVDWENYAIKGALAGYAEDVCCHYSSREAENCAYTFLTHGWYCRDRPVGQLTIGVV